VLILILILVSVISIKLLVSPSSLQKQTEQETESIEELQPEFKAEEEPKLKPAHIVIDKVQLKKSYSPIWAQVYVNNTGDLPAYNITISLYIQFVAGSGLIITTSNGTRVETPAWLFGNVTITELKGHSSIIKGVKLGLVLKNGKIDYNTCGYIEDPYGYGKYWYISMIKWNATITTG